MKFGILCFGALNIDRLCRVERIARPGEESFILDRNDYPGGSAANTTVGLARLGIKTGFIGKVANDQEGRLLLKSFEEENVDIKGIVRHQKGRSGVVTGFIDNSGERTLYVDPGVNDTLVFEDINLDYARSSEFLHFTSFVGQKPFEAQNSLIAFLSGTKISFDPGEIYVRKGLKVLNQLISKTHVLFLNEKELRILTGMSCQSGANFLIKKGIKYVFIKRGKKGCFVTSGKSDYFIPPYPAEVVDTTGAGDAFCAGVLFGLLKKMNLYDCGRIGNFVASRCISKMGARNGLPRISEVKEVLELKA